MEEDRITIEITEEQRQEVAICLKRRVDDLKKERKRLTERELPLAGVDGVIAIHHGDGALSGLAAKFADRDTGNLFEAPKPVGKVLARLYLKEDKGEPLFIHEEGGIGDLTAGLAYDLPGWFPEEQEGLDPTPLLVDERGELFRVVPVIKVQAEYLGTKCQEEGCWAPATRAGFCSAHYVQEEEEAAAEEEKQDPAESILEQKMALARQMIQDAGFITIKRRKDLLAYLEAEADETWVELVLELGPKEKMPALPSGYVADNRDPYHGMKLTQVAEILAREKELPREMLEGKGTGKGGRITKGDVEDAINAMISAQSQADLEAREAGEEEATGPQLVE